MGRARQDQRHQDHITRSIDEQYRAIFSDLGLDKEGVEVALDYAKRGFTIEAAAKIALAGGNHKAAINQEEKVA